MKFITESGKTKQQKEDDYIPKRKIESWSVNRRIESLRQMDRRLAELKVASRDTIWKEYGGGLRATQNETIKHWQHIAEDDTLYENAIFCYMVCTLEPYTLCGFEN